MERSSTATNDIYCDMIRRQIEHEDGLVVNRLSWLVASQSFLFTAYAIGLNGPLQARSAILEDLQNRLLRILPALAIVVCVLIYLGVLAAVHVIAVLHRELSQQSSGPAGMKLPFQGTRTTLVLGFAAPLVLPPIFGLAWVLLLAR